MLWPIAGLAMDVFADDRYVPSFQYVHPWFRAWHSYQHKSIWVRNLGIVFTVMA